MVHPDLVHENEYLRAELEIYRSRQKKRLTISTDEKYRLLKRGLLLGGRLKKIITVVHYATFRRWVSGNPETIKQDRRGRPRITLKEIESLVVRMAKENPGWGFARIRAELQRLFKCIPSRNTVKAILIRHGIPPAPKRNHDTWDAYIKRTFETLWACDFFTKTVWTTWGPRAFYVLFFINIHTRKVHIAGITKYPKKEWMTQRSKTFQFLSSGKDGRKLLVRDRDTKFTKEFDRIIQSYGIEIKKIPYRSPNLNPYAESWVSTIKKECLDRFTVFGAQHLEYLVQEYVKYYNALRPHSGMNGKPLAESEIKWDGEIQCQSLLGGLVNRFYRE